MDQVLHPLRSRGSKIGWREEEVGAGEMRLASRGTDEVGEVITRARNRVFPRTTRATQARRPFFSSLFPRPTHHFTSPTPSYHGRLEYAIANNPPRCRPNARAPPAGPRPSRPPPPPARPARRPNARPNHARAVRRGRSRSRSTAMSSSDRETTTTILQCAHRLTQHQPRRPRHLPRHAPPLLPLRLRLQRRLRLPRPRPPHPPPDLHRADAVTHERLVARPRDPQTAGRMAGLDGSDQRRGRVGYAGVVCAESGALGAAAGV